MAKRFTYRRELHLVLCEAGEHFRLAEEDFEVRGSLVVGERAFELLVELVELVDDGVHIGEHGTVARSVLHKVGFERRVDLKRFRVKNLEKGFKLEKLGRKTHRVLDNAVDVAVGLFDATGTTFLLHSALGRGLGVGDRVRVLLEELRECGGRNGEQLADHVFG